MDDAGTLSRYGVLLKTELLESLSFTHTANGKRQIQIETSQNRK